MSEDRSEELFGPDVPFPVAEPKAKGKSGGKTTSFSPKTVDWLRKRGWQVANCEKVKSHMQFDPQLQRRVPTGFSTKEDLFGFMDEIAFHPDGRGTLAIQTKSRSAIGAGVRASCAGDARVRDALVAFLKAGNRFAVFGWYQEGRWWKVEIFEVRLSTVAHVRGGGRLDIKGGVKDEILPKVWKSE